MQKNDFQIEKYIKLRQDLHKIPEVGFKEFKNDYQTPMGLFY